MREILEKLKPEPHDLLVVPDDFDVPNDVGCLVHKIKFLHTPSIIRSRGSSMKTTNELQFRNDPSKPTSFWAWLLSRFPTPQELEILEATANKKQDTVVEGSFQQVMEVPMNYYRHVRIAESGLNMASTGGATLKVSLLPESEKLSFSFAVCSDYDNFNKRIGINIAEARFNGGVVCELENFDSVLSTTENIKHALKVFLTEPEEAYSIPVPKIVSCHKAYDKNILKKLLQNLEDSF